MTGWVRRTLSSLLGLLQAVARGALSGAAARWQDLREARDLFSGDGPGLRELPRLLQQLHHEGGLRVASDDASGRPVAVTVVMPDGDVVSRVSPDLIDQPALWQSHREALRRRLAPLRQVPALSRCLSGVLTLVVYAVCGYVALGLAPAMGDGLDALWTRAVELVRELEWAAVAGGVAGGMRYGFGWWLRAQVNKLFA